MSTKFFATMSSKNQIVIPVVIRETLGLKVGDKVEFDLQSGQITIKKATFAKDPYLEAMEQVFAEEWNSEEDSRFDDLLEI